MSTDVALHPLAAPADVDLYVLQSYELEFAGAVDLAATAGGVVLTPGTVPPPPTHDGGVRLRPPAHRPPRPPARHAVHCRADLALAASMTLTLAPFGRWAEEDLLFDLA